MQTRPKFWKTGKDNVNQRRSSTNTGTGKPQEAFQGLHRDVMGLVNDQDNFASTFVLFEPCLLEMAYHGTRIIDSTIKPRCLADDLQHFWKGESRVQYPDRLVLPMIDMFEHSTEQQSLAHSGLPHKRYTSLGRFYTVQESLQSSLMARTRKEKGRIRRIRERVLCKVIKFAIHV
jgi:hypothetical protein